ncbi:hypothetical protein GCM10018790_78120 [Kitasatospora xanthocidica]|uniref:hypothetical protein n=2 Tax=Kitasatospora xanthocidica TaxID=83382 RepID=UPI0016745229|nr:hypothetical protein [Kitasatospora xanthocidica]GHF89111.1 hypothetical protein GCM10018790_78120 [Kitasatospora xanthocidica]
MGHLKVDPNEIHMSAGVARAIGEDFAKPCQAAVTAGQTAAGQLVGWSVGSRLGQVATNWAPVLTSIGDRLKKTADNLTATAQAYTNNENANAEVWQKQRIGDVWEKPGQ